MAKPRTYGARVQTQMRLPIELHQRLIKEADARTVSVNLLVTRAVEDYLDRLIPVEDMVRTADG